MTTETMREAVEMAILEAAGGMEHGKPANISVLADAAIRTVLERLREPTSAMVDAGQAVDGTITAEDVWQAMLDASCAGGGVNGQVCRSRDDHWRTSATGAERAKPIVQGEGA